MNCRECQDHFEAALSGQLDASVRATVEAHLHHCATCASAFAEEHKLWTLLDHAAKIEPSHGFADRVLRRLDEAPEDSSPWWTDARYWLRWAAGAAAVAIVCVAAVRIHHQNRLEQDNARLQHFEELFSVVQADDPDAILMITPTGQNGDTL
jgi:anti-sigma factor RsiW